MARKHPDVPTPEPGPVFDTSPVRRDVTRVSATDLERVGWIIPFIQEDFGDPKMETILRWMRQWANANDYCFVQTENGVALAWAASEPMRIDPIVREVFLYVKGTAEEGEGASLYRHIAEWAHKIRAARFEFYGPAEMTVTKVRGVFPEAQQQRLFFVET